MHRFIAAIAALLLSASLSLGTARAAGPAEFGQLPAISDTSISPNGSRLAWFANTADGPVVVVQPLDGTNATIVPLGQNKPRNLIWASDTVVLVGVSATTRFQGNYQRQIELFRTISIDLSTGKFLMLKVGGDSALNSITVDRVASDGSGDVFVSVYEFRPTSVREPTSRIGSETMYDNAFVLTLYRVDPVTGETDDIVRGENDTVDFIMGRNDEVLARADIEDGTRKMDIMARDGGGWRKIVTVDNVLRGGLSFAGLEPGGNGILMIDNRGAVAKIVRLDLASGAMTPALQGVVTGSVGGTRVDPFTGEAVSVREEGLTPKRRWIDTELGSISGAAERAFPGKTVTIYDWTPTRHKFVIHVDGPSDIPTFYLLDRKTMQAIIIGEEYPQLLGTRIGTQSLISYPARDGTPIPAYLTMPPGGVTKNLPVVVLPHGGPEARDYGGFDWLSQFFATRGYVVLQPQFRGSDGFGKAWADAGRRQWGGLMQDDVSDGVKYLIANGTANPAKVCIVGASYGGYAALAGATLTPELYACAISISGVSDLPEMIGWVSARTGDESGSVMYWRDHIGPPSDPAVIAASPARNVEGIRAPVLLIHGRDDTVVPFAQSEKMDRAMRAAGKPVTLIELSGEDHWMSRAPTRTRLLQELDKFLAQHLGG